MSRAANSLKTSDVIITPIKLKYTSSYTNSTLTGNGIEIITGSNGPVTVTGSVPQDTLNYRSIQHLFYSNFLTGSYPVSASSLDNSLQSTAASGTLDADRRYFPTESGAKVTVLSIPRKVYGEQISRKGFRVSSSGYNLIDDGNGNIVDTLSGSLQVGNIIYSQGLVVITNQDYLNVFNQLPTYSVGQLALGGVIAYIYQPGDPGYDPEVQHGLVAQIQEAPYWDGTGPQPVIPRYEWYFANILTSATGSTIGTGLTNTDKIISLLGSGSYAAYVARICNDGGYNDWFLPSEGELAVMYTNRALIGGFATGSLIPPTFSLPAYPEYWTSTEPVTSGTTSARRTSFQTGTTSNSSKLNQSRIRPVRYF